MCKKILQILFPLNIFGKDKQTIMFDLNTVPWQGSGAYRYRTITIVWSGDRLIVNSTKVNSSYAQGTSYENVKDTFTDGDNTTETITYGRRISQLVSYWTKDEIYFNCTNVTSLVVNGETLI